MRPANRLRWPFITNPRSGCSTTQVEPRHCGLDPYQISICNPRSSDVDMSEDRFRLPKQITYRHKCGCSKDQGAVGFTWLMLNEADDRIE
jgi:hypothetical protein